MDDFMELGIPGPGTLAPVHQQPFSRLLVQAGLVCRAGVAPPTPCMHGIIVWILPLEFHMAGHAPNRVSSQGVE